MNEAPFPTSLARKPGRARHLTEESAAILKRYFHTGKRPADAARQFKIHYMAARHRFLGWRFA